MNAIDTRHLWEPFVDPVIQAQQAFRKIMKAIAEPGTLMDLGETYHGNRGAAAGSFPRPELEAAFVIALSLLDRDTAVWVSPALAQEDFTDNLRFHCGARLTTTCREADFAFLRLGELRDLSGFKRGDEERPQCFATVIALVDDLRVPTASPLSDLARESPMLRLTGPGIREQALLCLHPFTTIHEGLLRHNREDYPLGFDLLLVKGRHLVGLPRSTRVDRLDGSRDHTGGSRCMSR